MSIEIQSVRLLLPATVLFKQDGEDVEVFVYIDQLQRNVIIPDETEINDVEEFKKQFSKFYNPKKPVIIPKVPSINQPDKKKYGVNYD